MIELTAYKADIYIPVYGSIADAEVYLKDKVDKLIVGIEESHKREVEQLLMEIVRLKDKVRDYVMLVQDYQQKLAEIEESQRWRKVREEPPEEDEDILASDGKYIYKGCFTRWDGGCSDFSCQDYYGFVEDGSEEAFKDDEIKYWMLMPKAPEDN